MIERKDCTIYYHCDDEQHIFETDFTALFLFLLILILLHLLFLILHQALQLPCLKVLVFSITSFYLT